MRSMHCVAWSSMSELGGLVREPGWRGREQVGLWRLKSAFWQSGGLLVEGIVDGNVRTS